jgi:hypothetical protein
MALPRYSGRSPYVPKLPLTVDCTSMEIMLKICPCMNQRERENDEEFHKNFTLLRRTRNNVH